MEYELAIVPIESDDDSSFLPCPPYDDLIRCTGRVLRNGQNILARFPQSLYGSQWDVLVRKQSHDAARTVNR